MEGRVTARWSEALEAIRLHLEHDPESHSVGLGFKKIPMKHIQGLHTLHKPNTEVKIEASAWKLKGR